MIDFKEITLKDREWILPILKQCDYNSCEYSFGNNFIWKNAYSVMVANVDGFYVEMSNGEDGIDNVSFLYPAGEGDVTPIIEKLIDYCKEKNFTFKMHGMLETQKRQLNLLFPGKFVCEAPRSLSDYIYVVKDLVELAGKKYHGKRNHIRRFKDNNWTYESLNEDNIQECATMNSEWCAANDCKGDKGKSQEYCAVKRAIKYFTQLEFIGGLLRVDGKVIAFTLAERLNSNTIVIHIEKAFSEIQGAYPAINNEFLKNLAENFIYVNREEDMGVEGLRKAKLSYNPVILLDKYIVKLA